LSRSWLIFPLLILYLVDLGGVGFLGPDEPRYASIGREMARSHDFVTPRLDGKPWFEKPPLLYWLIAAGRAARLPDEWAARLPVALASLAFIIFFYRTLLEEFSPRIALAATSILATSAGWIGFSFAAVPDLLMSAALGAAMCIAMFDTRRAQGYLAGGLLGVAILAKAFVPLVLFAPLFLIARGKRMTMLAGCVLVAAPWHILCSMKYGQTFWQEYFWKQQFARITSTSLQHVQPFWYYVPVILAGLFPWTPLAGLLFRRKTYDDVRVRFLIAWLVYALLFFSLAPNKLPGYMLPLLPALAIVLAIAIDAAGTRASWWLGLCTLLLVALPLIPAALPDALLSGVRGAPRIFTPALLFAAAAVLVWWLSWTGKPTFAILAAAMAVFFGVAYVKAKVTGKLDDRVSVRSFWRAHPAFDGCVDPGVRREWQYGLNYYAGRPLALCDDVAGPRIAIRDGKLAVEQR
jgi:4-amino-4-deoxy-L-arabinose transferase-like glycosyltransferase